MAAMSIRLSDEDKKQADILFKEMGLTINSAINMFIKQCIRKQGLPFTPSVKTEKKPNKELLEALEELKYAETHPEKYQGYNNINEFIEDMLK